MLQVDVIKNKIINGLRTKNTVNEQIVFNKIIRVFIGFYLFERNRQQFNLFRTYENIYDFFF